MDIIGLDTQTIDDDLCRDGGPSENMMTALHHILREESTRLLLHPANKAKIDRYLDKLQKDNQISIFRHPRQALSDLVNPYKLNKRNFNNNDNIQYFHNKDHVEYVSRCDYYICSAELKPYIQRLLEQGRRREAESIQKAFEKMPDLEKSVFNLSETNLKAAYKVPKIMPLGDFADMLTQHSSATSTISNQADLSPEDIEKLRRKTFQGKLIQNMLTNSLSLPFLLIVCFLYQKLLTALLQQNLDANDLEVRKYVIDAKTQLGNLALFLKKNMGRLGYVDQEKSLIPVSVLFNKSINKQDFFSIIVGILLVLEALNKSALAGTADVDILPTLNASILESIQNTAQETVESFENTGNLLALIIAALDFTSGLSAFSTRYDGELSSTIANTFQEIYSPIFEAQLPLVFNTPALIIDEIEPSSNSGFSFISNAVDSFDSVLENLLSTIVENPTIFDPLDGSEPPSVLEGLNTPSSIDKFTSNTINESTVPDNGDISVVTTVVDELGISDNNDPEPLEIISPLKPSNNDISPKTLEFVFYGDGNDNFISASSNDDKVIGESGDDVLLGLTGDDHLVGGEGDDILRGGPGADILNGGTGNDIASYVDANIAVDIDLSTGFKAGAAEDDTFISIEGVEATRYDDSVQGNNNNNVIYGLGGDDNLTGQGGNDLIDGGEGRDQIKGGDDNDILAGGIGDDVIFGGDGDDLIRGDLNRSDTQSEILGGDDIIYGGKGNDRIGGKTGNDFIAGGEGNDDLWGGKGNDTLYGGPGKDILTGLDGNDIFQLNPFQGETDIITDFNSADDSIQMISDGLFNALPIGQLNRAMFVLGANPTDANDRIIYNPETNILSLDLDGTGPQQAIELAILSNQPFISHSDIFIM